MYKSIYLRMRVIHKVHHNSPHIQKDEKRISFLHSPSSLPSVYRKDAVPEKTSTLHTSM